MSALPLIMRVRLSLCLYCSRESAALQIAGGEAGRLWDLCVMSNSYLNTWFTIWQLLPRKKCLTGMEKIKNGNLHKMMREKGKTEGQKVRIYFKRKGAHEFPARKTMCTLKSELWG